MGRLVLNKFMQALLILPGIVVLLFIVFSLLGDPTRMLAGQRADTGTLESIRRDLGLDEPTHIQFALYLRALSPIDCLDAAAQASGDYHFLRIIGDATGSWVVKAPYLRRSYQTGQPVFSIFWDRFPATLILTAASLCIATLLGISLGIIAAVQRDTFIDRALSFVSMLGISAPSFFVAVLFIAVFAIWLYPLTQLNLTGYVITENVLGEGYTLQLKNLIIPALTLGIRPLSLLFQLTRNGMIEALGADYIRTARAKGLAPTQIVLKHALPNAIGPVLTSLSGWFASLLTGAFFIEYIFDWPGIGKLMVDALYTNDYPVVLGSCLLTAVLFLVITLVVDLLYPLLDPRVRLTA